MKKVLSIALVAGMFAFIACGPSQKDADAEKATKDSMDAAAAVMAQDSMAAAAAAAAAMVDTAAQMAADTTAK